MCQYTEDAPNARCTERGVEIISRKVIDQVISIININQPFKIIKTSNKIKSAAYENITD